MANRYEIQCPNCGGALVLPANNSKELQEYYKITEGTHKQCPACLYVFRGLMEKENHNESWNMIVDKNGSRFRKAEEYREALFKHANEHHYLRRNSKGKIVTENEEDA